MSSPAFAFKAARRPAANYARPRLLLGITGVGTAVVMSCVALTNDLPARWLSTSPTQSPVEALGSIGAVTLFGLLAFALFDLIGGALLVRQRQWAATWMKGWARGVAVQWVVWMLSAATLLLTARAGGRWAALLAFAAAQLVLASLRGPLARMVASLSEPTGRDASGRDASGRHAIIRAAQQAGLDDRRVIVIDADDEGFVGGWTGIRGARLYVPLRWASLPDTTLIAALTRRRITRESGAHRRGVLGAMVWNVVGFAVVLVASTAALTSAADVLTVALGMTLWTFLGVLLLPTLSRHAVYAVDDATAALVDQAALRDAIERLDRWQDDEANRPRLVEAVFHPVPARTHRVRRLARAAPVGHVRWFDAHHIARHALSLSWAALTPLSRLVHCNVGRPALWVMLPGD